MDLLTYLFFLFLGGLLLGAIARLLVPGTGGMGLLATSLAGIGGSFGAGLIVRYLVDPREDWVGIAIAIGVAAVLVALMRPRYGPAGVR